MKKLSLIAALALAAFSMRAQNPTVSKMETVNDTVIGGVRYAVFTGLSGTDFELYEAFPVDETALVADINNRLRSIAVYQAVAVPCAVAAPFFLGYAFPNVTSNKDIPFDERFHCDRPAMAAIGIGLTAASVICGVLSYTQLWTRKVYATQDGIIIRLGNKKN